MTSSKSIITPSTSADLETRQVCYTLFSKFIKEVLVRVQQYKEELLASCIQLVLSIPKQFVEIATLVPALQTALKMGLRYPCIRLTYKLLVPPRTTHHAPLTTHH
jgi:hypothetical protein